jgi:hypothetical protein
MMKMCTAIYGLFFPEILFLIEDAVLCSTEDDSVESNSSRHEFLQVAKARLIAHVYLIDWLTGSSKEHRNASHIPAVQCLNSDCLGGNALGIAFLQVIFFPRIHFAMLI